MEVTDQKKDKCSVIHITGRLDTTNYTVLEKKLMELIDSGESRLLVNLAKMDYVSSSGLRILLMALKRVAVAKGKFALCSLQENIKEIFEISGFTNIFEIYTSEEEGIKAF
ncbi:MAG: STAS domain-containing protein [bacterium]